MDTEVFLARCESLDDGLHDLVNDCYDSLTEGASAEERDRLVSLAKEKINLFNELSADVVHEPHKEEIQSFNRYIKQLNKFVQEA
jgi:hypothetical protein